MQLKETLHMGKTSFEMKANLPTKEKTLQAEWEADQVYEQRQAKNADLPTFILHDGPPYANGKIHMGHALNKISKDFIIRYKSMSGFRAPYVPGWDTHGLPIESALQKNQGINRKEHSTVDFRKMCADYAISQVEGQKATFKRLGVGGDWENPYLTLLPEYEAQQLRVFAKMVDKGCIYQGAKPVYWSWSSESSLAEAEVEYQDVTSPSIFVAFNVKDGKGILPEDAEFVIWTTTPWTLPANLGISVSGAAEYALVRHGDRKFVVAQDLLTQVAETLKWGSFEVLETFKGQELDRMTAHHPFYDRESLVMVGDHVTLDSGTGLVHTAPGHGEDDYRIGLAYGLDILSPVDSQGHFTAEAPGFEGVFYIKAQKEILALLEEKEALLHYSEFVHSYPHDWRTKKPVIYRATPQWFASIDKIRQDLLDQVEHKITWHHPSGQRRIYNMIRDRGDWVISRQRLWGLPLPIFYAEDGTAILSPEVINQVADLVEKEGSNIWFERDAKDLLPAGFTHPGSPNGEFKKEMDIMDVWFDSGTSYAGVLQSRDYLEYPADLYLEGSDQYRGWFNSSLTTSVAAYGQAPYKAVVSQGFVNDGKGQKMSKSLGNVIDPEDIMADLGADIIRLWVASVDYESDVRVSQEILKQVAESYRKIRNTIRFMLGLVGDFNPGSDGVADADLMAIDQYMLAKFKLFRETCLAAYDKYDFMTVYREVNNFVNLDLSAFYLDVAKDIVYIEAEDALARRSQQTVIYQIVKDLMLMLTPILVHTMEEGWKALPGSESYIQLQEMPERVADLSAEQALVDKWQVLFELRSGVNKALEEAKNWEADPIKKSFEAAVTLYVDADKQAQLEALGVNLAQTFIVSNLDFAPYANVSEGILDFEDYAVKVERAQGHICSRCRAVRTEVGTIEGDPEMCQRCHDIVADHFPEYFNQEA